MTRNDFAANSQISLRGGRQHNLQAIDLDLNLDELTVICGVSGSGKTSLALDTLYAEGQRRYIESFSAYTRQFLQRIEKPKFDSLVNLPPSIAITRELKGRNNRSTVGTSSEILEYLRIVFAQCSSLFCISCQRLVQSHHPKTIAQTLQTFPKLRALLGFEFQWQSKVDLAGTLADLQSAGLIRMVVENQTIHLADTSREILASRFAECGKAFVIVDRVRLGNGSNDLERVSQSLATVFEQSQACGHEHALVMVESEPSHESAGSTLNSSRHEVSSVDGIEYSVFRYSPSLRCEYCNIDYPESEPRLFNFNNPIGACEMCEGFGETVSVDMAKVVPDRTLSLRDGAIAPWRTPAYVHEHRELLALADDFKIPVNVPVSKLTSKQWRLIQEGVPDRNFGGLNGFFAWLERKKYKMHVRAFLARWRSYSLCAQCHGKRLNANALAYRLLDKTFADLCEMSLDTLSLFVSELGVQRADVLQESIVRDSDSATMQELYPEPSTENFMLAAERKSLYAASEPLRQLTSRAKYLQTVGVGYLSLSRPMHTLSSGESQRVRMTTLLGSSLVDMLYVFDEPTVGLHPQDTQRIANAILELRDRGNTVVLVEHEPHLIRVADRIVEIGPGAGELGGKVTFHGTPREVMNSDCVTAKYLRQTPTARAHPRPTGDRWLELRGANGRSLSDVDLRVPLGCLTLVIGPSGSGKSSLVLDTLCPAIESVLKGSDRESALLALPYGELIGSQWIEDCLAIDQSPIQRSIRSCPATYCKAMDDIRDVFSQTVEAKAKGFGSGYFSFNSELGRCPACEGLGFTTVDMQFMADLQLPCTDCNGDRFRAEVLEVRYRDINISEVLKMSVGKASSFFRGCGSVQERLKPLLDLGLGYLPLGQNLASLSAGESMRLKLAGQLQVRKDTRAGPSTKGKLIVLDEPTAGLHFQDVEKLIQCVDVLIDQGNTVLIIEHNQQIIMQADYVVELGPGAGPLGGRIIAEGTLSNVCSNKNSVTAPYLTGS